MLVKVLRVDVTSNVKAVAVVGGDEQDVACVLARLVDRADGLISEANGFDGSVVDTGVADLYTEKCKSARLWGRSW